VNTRLPIARVIISGFRARGETKETAGCFAQPITCITDADDVREGGLAAARAQDSSHTTEHVVHYDIAAFKIPWRDGFAREFIWQASIVHGHQPEALAESPPLGHFLKGKPHDADTMRGHRESWREWRGPWYRSTQRELAKVELPDVVLVTVRREEDSCSAAVSPARISSVHSCNTCAGWGKIKPRMETNHGRANAECGAG